MQVRRKIMLNLSKKQYFALFILSFLTVSASTIYDAICNGTAVTAGVISAFAIAVGFMSKVKKGV